MKSSPTSVHARHARLKFTMIVSNGKKYFTLSEANTLVPQIQGAFGRLQIYRQELADLSGLLAKEGFDDPQTLFDVEVSLPPELSRLRGRARELLNLMNSEIEKIHEAGCLVKDLDAGLVDFYSRRDGQDIFLCWQGGEPEILFWHEVEAGFAGRKPIDDPRRTRERLN